MPNGHQGEQGRPRTGTYNSIDVKSLLFLESPHGDVGQPAEDAIGIEVVLIPLIRLVQADLDGFDIGTFHTSSQHAQTRLITSGGKFREISTPRPPRIQ